MGTVALREVIPEDLPTLFAQQFDPQANEMAAFPARNRLAFMAHWKRILADPALVTRAILFNGKIAGHVGCFELSGERLVGYWIGREYWGQGIASRALSQFLTVVSERPLYARVARHNVASIRVLEKCGFMVEREEKANSAIGGDEVEELVMKLK